MDDNAITRHVVPRPAMVKSVHVIPIEWENNFALRLELYGCIAGWLMQSVMFESLPSKTSENLFYEGICKARLLNEK